MMKRSRNLYHYQIRKCKKAEEKVKKNKLLDACLNGDVDLFTEIKKMRKIREQPANTIDGVSKVIPGHFAKIYIVISTIQAMIVKT